MSKEIFIKEENVKIFVLDDSIAKVKTEKENEQFKLFVEYPFETELLVAFSFKVNKEGYPIQKAYFINGKEDVKDIRFKREFVETYIEDKKLIFNGSFYQMIN